MPRHLSLRRRAEAENNIGAAEPYELLMTQLGEAESDDLVIHLDTQLLDLLDDLRGAQTRVDWVRHAIAREALREAKLRRVDLRRFKK